MKGKHIVVLQALSWIVTKWWTADQANPADR
jgi:hypothetical protein